MRRGVYVIQGSEGPFPHLVTTDSGPVCVTTDAAWAWVAYFPQALRRARRARPGPTATRLVRNAARPAASDVLGVRARDLQQLDCSVLLLVPLIVHYRRM